MNTAIKNKAAFDILYNHKSEIEDTLSISLIWDRWDNKKASCVSYPLEVGSSLTKEANGPQIANFHAECSSKSVI